MPCAPGAGQSDDELVPTSPVADGAPATPQIRGSQLAQQPYLFETRDAGPFLGWVDPGWSLELLDAIKHWWPGVRIGLDLG